LEEFADRARRELVASARRYASAPARAQLWKLRTVEKHPENPWDELQGIAKRRGVETASLWESEMLSDEELTG
jgi:hypothetical protein